MRNSPRAQGCEGQTGHAGHPLLIPRSQTGKGVLPSQFPLEMQEAMRKDMSELKGCPQLAAETWADHAKSHPGAASQLCLGTFCNQS